MAWQVPFFFKGGEWHGKYPPLSKAGANDTASFPLYQREEDTTSFPL